MTYGNVYFQRWANSGYVQLLAINKTIEAISQGRNRILRVMATGTGKIFTAFQIIWRLWKSKVKRRILFLADRNILISCQGFIDLPKANNTF